MNAARSGHGLGRSAQSRQSRGRRRFLHDVAPVIRSIARARGGGLGESAVEDVVQVALRHGASVNPRARGVEIPGNRVVGVFAVSILELSTAAMIEAPARFYVTENRIGIATLSWKTPSFVFAPYLDEGGDAFAAIVAELDTKFDAIATRGTRLLKLARRPSSPICALS